MLTGLAELICSWTVGGAAHAARAMHANTLLIVVGKGLRFSQCGVSSWGFCMARIYLRQ
jgi:hypothetical protein